MSHSLLGLEVLASLEFSFLTRIRGSALTRIQNL
jgi:hypothetical protein